jgi:hypothetical protein
MPYWPNQYGYKNTRWKRPYFFYRIGSLNRDKARLFAVCLIKNKAMFRTIQVIVLGIAVSVFSVDAIAQEDGKDNKGYSNKDKSNIPVNNETPTKNIEKVVGVWEATGIFKGTKEITDTDTVGLNRSFEFTRDNKYVSYSDSEQIDSGAFKLNEVQNTLYLESFSGNQNEVAEFKIRFDNNTMTLQPAQSADAHAQRFRYVYTRKREGN